MYFYKNHLYSWALMRKPKYIVKMTKEGFISIVNFMIPGAGLHVPWCGHTCTCTCTCISHVVKGYFFF